MHKILLSIVLLFAAISSAIAQKLTIESFKLATSDLTAQTQPRKDLNNRNCAVVKVQFVGELTNIEGNVIMPLVKRNNETWVYMPQNTRQINIITKNFLPLMVTFADYGIERLESNRTYVLTLWGNSQQQVQQSQTLTIRYSPSSATVLVDNKMVKGMNGVAQTTLPVGQHSYIVFCDGYESEEGTVKLKASAPSNLQITLSTILDGSQQECSILGAHFISGVFTIKNKQYEGIKIDKLDSGKIKMLGIKEGSIFQIVNREKINTIDDFLNVLKSQEEILYIQLIAPNGKKQYYAMPLK